MDGLGEHYSAVPYATLHGPDEAPESSSSLRVLALALSTVVFVSLVAMLTGGPEAVPEQSLRRVDARAHLVLPLSRGKAAGVSEKSSEASAFMGSTRYTFSWTNAMLQWQRTAFHFQPEKNWMNDPNGPVYYKGWYHLFYQYNPKGAVWGNIAWGHAVSRDLVNWLQLPLAMVPDQWYDANGVFTGSATILPDGKLVMLYTGSSNDFAQVQCLAVPADPNDPLLLNWTKSDANPVLMPPPGIGRKDFRDPTTAWWDADDSAWRVIIGSKDENHAGISIVYRTRDFVSYERLPGVLHAVPRTGMWECVDFYPVAMAAEAGGLDTSTSPGEGVKHVLKASMDDDRHDYYAIGKFYASKTFYDQAKGRRVLWGWVGETDSELADVHKGWASLQGIPRTVLYDNKTGSNLLQWPVEEVENLRTSSDAFMDIEIHAGSVLPLNVSSATQLDIEAVFQINASALAEAMEIQIEYNCSTSGGAASRGALGPFGLLVLANSHLSEQTAVYFYVSRRPDGDLRTHLCHDETRSSQANDIVKSVVGSTVPVLDGEKLSVRILVDHTIVESFAQGGRTCITSRVYPTKAIYREAGVFLFNNATNACVTAKSIKIWRMNSAALLPYPLQA